MSTLVGSGATRPLDDDRATRGGLVIADKVIEKIAARAAGEVAHTVSIDSRRSERLPGRSGHRARATAIVSGRIVQLRLRVALGYPAPVAALSREVRRHVADTVARLCGVEVRDVDIEIVRLRREHPGRRS